MKRTSQAVVGGPTVAESGSPDVAGASMHRGLPEVALCVDGLGDACVCDAALAEEFADFLAGDVAAKVPTFPAADPIFRERLRRRLWRIHVLTQAPGSHEPN